MKIMVFGDVATGKSTFSQKLSSKLNIPVIHLDRVMDDIGHHNDSEIKEFIFIEADKQSWIMEGNAFSRDPDGYRINRADKIIIFKSSRIKSFISHLKRHFFISLGLERRRGSDTSDLNLNFYIPYIFWQFPRGMDWALSLVEKSGKKPIFVRSFKEADELLEKF